MKGRADPSFRWGHASVGCLLIGEDRHSCLSAYLNLMGQPSRTHNVS